jgi:hypothetical protein
MNATTSANASRMNFSPRAAVAFSFLDSVHWLRAKLHSLFTRAIHVQAAPLAQPHYHR